MQLFFYFSRIFSHQHVQMIMGPHEKSGVENFFTFRKKINIFKNYAPVQDIVAEQKYFNTIFFISPVVFSKKV